MHGADQGAHATAEPFKTQSLALRKRQSKARLEQIKRQLTELEAWLPDLTPVPETGACL